MSEFRYMDRVRARERADAGLPPPAAPSSFPTELASVSAPDSPHADVSRVLGGSPLGVFARLLVLSFIVGAALRWLDIRPVELLWQAEDVARRIWAFGFGGLREALGFTLAGAMVVVPLWLLSRLFGGRRG